MKEERVSFSSLFLMKRHVWVYLTGREEFVTTDKDKITSCDSAGATWFGPSHDAGLSSRDQFMDHVRLIPCARQCLVH